MQEFEFSQLEVGQTAKFERTFSLAEIDEFTKLTGDENPLHNDQVYASQTPFKNRVVHGMLAASLFSTLVGMYLPGKYCLYLSQEVNFHRPVYPNTPLAIEGKISRKIVALQMLEIETRILDLKQTLLIEGKAKVKVLK